MQTGKMRPPHPGRRMFMQGGAAAAVASAYGVAPGLALAQNVPNQYDGSKFQLTAAEPNPKKGGVLRVSILSRQPHFDIHQSGTFANVGTQACMFDNLVRRDPRDGGKTIIPDLAHSWDVSPDGKRYTFFLRKGVLFHDGAELTSDDVKATFDRIVKPHRAFRSRAARCSPRCLKSRHPTSTPWSSCWPTRGR